MSGLSHLFQPASSMSADDHFLLNCTQIQTEQLDILGKISVFLTCDPPNLAESNCNDTGVKPYIQLEFR